MRKDFIKALLTLILNEKKKEPTIDNLKLSFWYVVVDLFFFCFDLIFVH